MVIHDINQDKQEAIVLIHPMNFSGQLMIESMAKKLGNEYRYIVPNLFRAWEGKRQSLYQHN